jgi:hypothetical protein
MDIMTAWAVLQTIAPLLRGKDDYPALKNEAGEPLPLHYMQHARASADDLGSVWKDGHTICTDAEGIPVARWSYSGQELMPVVGFTIQGLPVYENVGLDHPVWSTVRSNVPAHLGTPGSQGSTEANSGKTSLFGEGLIPYRLHTVPYVRGEKLAAKLGYFGPIQGGEALPPAESGSGSSPSKGFNIGSLLTLGGIAALVAGATLPGMIAIGAGVVMNAQTPGSTSGRSTPRQQWQPGDSDPDAEKWIRDPRMTDEEAEASWAAWLAAHPGTGQGRGR